ncbi:MAG: hypothetical protein JWN44_526 [Myxococcales bacterium]|nr:hypothetical protein [Myxococcales bacterium]
MRLAAVVVAVLVTMAPAAFAAEADAVRDARMHYDRGMAHYELGEFKSAVDEFKQAYALSKAPGLLFNLAQASRLAKDYEPALHFYRSYLRVRPDAPNRDDVERRITELEPIVEAHRRAEVDRPPTPAPRAVTPPPTVPDQTPGKSADRSADTTAETTPETTRASDAPLRPMPPGGKKERVAGLVIGAVGVAALGAGIGLGVASLDAQNSLSKLATSMGSWSPAEANLYQLGQQEATAATAMYVVGGAALATGVILYIVGVRKDHARFAVAPAPGGGAQAVWSCAF